MRLRIGGQTSPVCHCPNRRCAQPRQSKKAVEHHHQTAEDYVQIKACALLQAALLIDELDSDKFYFEEKDDKDEEGRQQGADRDPPGERVALAVVAAEGRDEPGEAG